MYRRSNFCPHPSKCIVFGGPHKAYYESWVLKLIYSKVKDVITKPKGAEVACIQGQQKAIGERIIRDKNLQDEVAKQEKVKELSQNYLNDSLETMPPLNEF